MKSIRATAMALGGLAIMAAGSAEAATPYECQMYAQNVAEQQYPTGGGAVAGGVFGAIIGAGIAGATGGNVGTGAAIGAGGGLVVGSSAWQNKKKQAYDVAYSQCIGSGTPVYAPGPPVYGPPPPVYPGGSFNAVISGASSVNVRQGPGTQYAIIGSVVQGQNVGIQGCGGGWCALAGGYGYVSQSFVYPI